jgi:hypothetical protein
LFVESRDVLLLFVVIDDHQLISNQRRRTPRAEIQIDRIGFQRRRPHLLPFQVKRPQPQIRHVHVNEFAVGDGAFRRKAVFAMTPARRSPGKKLLLPFHLAAFQVQAIEEVMQHHFVRQFDVALGHFFDDLVHRQTLLLQFRDVFVAVFRAELRRLRFAVRRDGGQVDFAARHNRRRPSATGKLRRPFHVFSLRPAISQPRMRSHRIRLRPAKLRPVRVLTVSDERRKQQRAHQSGKPNQTTGFIYHCIPHTFLVPYL